MNLKLTLLVFSSAVFSNDTQSFDSIYSDLGKIDRVSIYHNGRFRCLAMQMDKGEVLVHKECVKQPGCYIMELQKGHMRTLKKSQMPQKYAIYNYNYPDLVYLEKVRPKDRTCFNTGA